VTATPDDDTSVERAVSALKATAEALVDAGFDEAHHVTDRATALDAVDRAEAALSAAVRTPEVHSALLDVRLARADLLAFQLARQRSMLPILNHGLSMLRMASTIDDLIDAVPIHAVDLGYDRALFSWVQDERWIPRSAHTVSEPQEASALLAAATEPYLHVRDLLEVDVVRQRRSLLVLDAVGNPRVHPELWQVSHSTTYVVAPVVSGGHVSAFVHLDRNLETGTTDEFDRDLLSAFCEGVGLMLDRFVAEAGASQPESVPAPLARSLATVLTEREREVLRLLSIGLTNAQIGQRLFIGEETTKTHVKRIMRKLGVHNRAQAGAVYHRLRAGAETRSG
jgi:DNA-binding CsgD family transcriptional regulator